MNVRDADVAELEPVKKRRARKEAPPPPPAPDFEVVPAHFARTLVKPRRPQVTWEPVIDALLDGKTLFITDENLSEGSLKYLRLVMSTRQAAKGQPRMRLHAQREYRPDGDGRLLWGESMDEAPTPVPAELVG